MLSGKNVLITGASRGLGLEVVRQLLRNPKGTLPQSPSVVIATCRNPDNAPELQALAAEEHNRLYIKKLDVTNFDSYLGFMKDELEPIIAHTGLNVLINNAGISGKGAKGSALQAEQLLKTYSTNAVGPLLFTRTLLPLLKLGAGHNVESGSLIVNMSSILGSIKLNHPTMSPGAGGIYPYRTSKCALNMITRSLSLDLHHLNIKTVAVHPGWVNTEMGGQNATLTPEESVAGVIDVIQHFDTMLYNGNLVDHKGQVLPS